MMMMIVAIITLMIKIASVVAAFPLVMWYDDCIVLQASPNQIPPKLLFNICLSPFLRLKNRPKMSNIDLYFIPTWGNVTQGKEKTGLSPKMSNIGLYFIPTWGNVTQGKVKTGLSPKMSNIGLYFPLGVMSPKVRRKQA